jgi:1-acyl-sn-glycerol-3-phosphate acyltransferase
VVYWVLKGILTPLMRVAYRMRVEGRENLPARGPVIVAANHRSFLDSLFIPLVIPRRVTFVAKAEYFDSWKTAWLFRALGQIPIRREGGSASEGALLAARDVLEAGGVFAIYPEGTRTRDGVTHRGHTGVARLAMQTGASIVPVGLIGSDDCQPIDSKLPRLFKQVTIRFGAPVSPQRYAERGGDALALRQMTDEVMFEIVSLCGRYDYHDTYATKKPDLEARPLDPARIATAGAPTRDRAA